MATQPPTTAPTSTEDSSRTPSARLNRDDRLRVLTLRDAGFTYQQISTHLRITHRQVQYTCQSQQITPKKAPGQPPKLSEEDVDRIIAFISSSKRTRRLSYAKVIQELGLPVGTESLARALKKRGYSRCRALPKPDLSGQSSQSCMFLSVLSVLIGVLTIV